MGPTISFEERHRLDAIYLSGPIDPALHPRSIAGVGRLDGGAGAAQSLDLARLADRLGYTRYWVAEHHNLPAIASSAPEIMIGQIARGDERACASAPAA